MRFLRPLFTVLPRSRSSLVLLAATLAMALVTTTLVAAVPMYSQAVVEAALRTTLAEAPPQESGIQAAFRDDTADIAEVGRVLDQIAADLPATLTDVRFATSDTYTLPEELAGDGRITGLASVQPPQAFERLFRTAAFTAGSRPALDAALHADAAAAFGLDVGDVVALARGTATIELEITRLVVPHDTADELWFRRPALRDGVVVDGSFTTVGPFIVSPTDLAATTGAVDHRWHAVIDPESIHPDDLRELRRQTASLARRLDDRLELRRVDVVTSLGDLTKATETAISSTAAVIAAVLLQLVGVALYGVAMAASALVGSRTVETTMLRARGATPTQVGAMAASEAIAIAAPAAVLGPPLAAQLVELVERWGPVAATRLDLRPTIGVGAFAASTLIALAVVVVVSVPAIRAAHRLGRPATVARADRQLWVQRGGADLALAAVAIWGLWRLSDSPVATSDLAGRLGTDPVLVVAPTVGAFAAALVTLRAIAAVAAVAQRLTARRGTLGVALAGWELARRPGRTARTAVLVVLSVTVGTFAAVHGASWQRSMSDQADVAVSADALVVADPRPAAANPLAAAPATYADVAGVDAVTPVGRYAAAFSPELEGVAVVAADSRQLPAMLRTRDDLLAPSDQERIAALRHPPPLPQLDLGEPLGQASKFALAYEVEPLTGDVSGAIELAATIADGFGTLHSLEATEIPVDVSPTAVPSVGTVEIELAASDRHQLVGPLALLELRASVPAVRLPPDGVGPGPAELTLTLSDARVDERPIALGEGWEVGAITLGSSLAEPALAISSVDGALRLRFSTGTTFQVNAPATATVTPPAASTGATDASTPSPVPMLVTPALLAATQLRVGDTATVRVGGASVPLEVAGVIPVVPFATAHEQAALVDWATLTQDRWLRTDRLEQPAEWALSVDARAADAAVETLTRPPIDSLEVTERRQLARRLSRAPVTVGLSGSLAMALAASTLVAIVGLILAAVVGARERRPQFAVLRAVGVRAQELRAWLLCETVPLVGVSALTGGVAGIALAGLALPSLTTRSDGTRAVPAPTIVIPWMTLGALFAVALVVGIALPIATARLLRRHRTADDLRIGDPT